VPRSINRCFSEELNIMPTDAVVIQGTLNEDGTLVLSGAVALPPGPVEVTVRPVAAAQGEDLANLLTRIRRSEAGTETSRSRNIAVSHEEVVLTEEDAEILRRMREDSTSSAGRPTRAPRRMQDG
jgi:hypothetical protein